MPRLSLTARLVFVLGLLTTCTPATHPAPAYTIGLTATDSSIHHRYFATDSESLGLGLTPLRLLTLPDGNQEIRVWSGGGIGETDVFRLARSSRRVVGTFQKLWRSDDTRMRQLDSRFIGVDSMMKYNFAGRCDQFTHIPGQGACTVRLVPRPDWHRIWDSLARLGAWTLADQSAQPRDNWIPRNDGTEILVELRDGPRYRVYQYDMPWLRSGPTFQQAAAIGNLLGSLWRSVPPATNEQTLSGKLDIGHRWHFLTPCGGSVTRPVEIPYPWLGAVQDSIPAGDTTHVARYAVLRGIPAIPLVPDTTITPPMWRLDVDSILTLHDWSPTSCAREPRTKR